MDFSKSSAPIFIIGYMASGKTTFGTALARELGRVFIDLDFYIVQRFHKTVSRMFEEDGEDTFRRREAAMIREVGEFENVVIACGGGTPCFHDNMDYMLGRGTVVFLDTTVERIIERLKVNNSRRPLMAGKNAEEMLETVKKGLQERLKDYERAHIRFSGDELEDRAQIDTTLRRFLNKE